MGSGLRVGKPDCLDSTFLASRAQGLRLGFTGGIGGFIGIMEKNMETTI